MHLKPPIWLMADGGGVAAAAPKNLGQQQMQLVNQAFLPAGA